MMSWMSSRKRAISLSLFARLLILFARLRLGGLFDAVGLEIVSQTIILRLGIRYKFSVLKGMFQMVADDHKLTPGEYGEVLDPFRVAVTEARAGMLVLDVGRSPVGAHWNPVNVVERGRLSHA